MGKMFVAVSGQAELASVFVAEFEDGAIAYSVSETLHYSLVKDTHVPGFITPPGSVIPANGSPIAGNPFAAWIPAPF
jgi:hypothetical protein